MKPAFLVVSGLFLVVAGTVSVRSVGSAAKMPPQVGGTICRFDFSNPADWPEKAAISTEESKATVTVAKVGTVDVAGGTEASDGLLFDASKGGAFVSGKLPVVCHEANADLLTLGFSLSASSTRPIAVSVESFDGAKRRTGGLETQIYPAAPQFYQRYSLDLTAMKPVGAGKFRPTDPLVQFRFSVSPSSASADAGEEIRLDNLNYASPAYYVSPTGSDKNDGRSEKTAFASPQRALDLAQPGDIVLLSDGTYTADNKSVASFPRPGQPDAWIVLKNYPGQHPTLSSTGWNIVNIAQGSKQNPYTGPALAYLEVRGLHIRGEGDVAKQKYPDAMNKADSRTNSNGISIDSRFTKNVFHHIRIADNLTEFCPGAGIGSIDGDWVQVENNVSRSNCWTTIYAPSGISVMGSANFDAQPGIYKRLVRGNLVCHNQTFEKWAAIGKYSDGNGIILDVNQGSDAHPTENYIGRTLVQSNLSFDNGGSGIHTVRANHVDIVGNTAYFNSASVRLEYGAIFPVYSNDVRIMNNIMVARVANVAAGEKPEPVNPIGGKCSEIVFAHNLYAGGNVAPTMGEGDAIGDPMFVNATIDHAIADFHLRPGSPAIGKGMTVPYGPTTDLDGKMRAALSPALGAYEAGK